MRDDVKQALGCGVSLAGLGVGITACAFGFIASAFEARFLGVAAIGLCVALASFWGITKSLHAMQMSTDRLWRLRPYRRVLSSINGHLRELRRMGQGNDLEQRVHALDRERRALIDELLKLDLDLARPSRRRSVLTSEQRQLQSRLDRASPHTRPLLHEAAEALDKTAQTIAELEGQRQHVLSQLEALDGLLGTLSRTENR